MASLISIWPSSVVSAASGQTTVSPLKRKARIWIPSAMLTPPSSLASPRMNRNGRGLLVATTPAVRHRWTFGSPATMTTSVISWSMLF